MLYLVLAIISMSAYMLMIKYLTSKRVNIPQVIMVNYILASALSVFIYKGGAVTLQALFSNNWWYLALASGALFFFSMHLMAASTRRAGVSVTTISSRTALVIPIIFSAVFLNESISSWQAVGIVLVIAALVIIFYGRDGAKGGAGKIVLPLGVFLIMGAITICMKSAQYIITSSGNYAADYPLYETMNFFIALLCAIIYYAATEGKPAFRFSWPAVQGGLCIGIFNYLVTHAILMALKSIPTGVLYASYNICVVILTAVAGWLLFGEKLSNRKIAGIKLALIAIAILMILG